MNSNRRKEIDRIMERIDSLIADISEIKDSIVAVCNEEQEALDNLPESMQEGERGERAQAAIDALEEALNGMDEAECDLNDAKESLETAKE